MLRSSLEGHSLVTAGSNVAPVEDGIVYVLRSACAVGECKLAVSDLATGRVFFHVIEISQGIFIFDLGAFLSGESDRPMGGIYLGEHNSTGIPLWKISIQPIQEASNVNRTTRCIGGIRHSNIENQGDCSQFSRGTHFSRFA